MNGRALSPSGAFNLAFDPAYTDYMEEVDVDGLVLAGAGRAGETGGGPPRRGSLVRLTREGDLTGVRSLLAATTTDIDRLEEGGVTALHCAARQNQQELIRLLLEHGATVNSCGEEESSCSAILTLFSVANHLHMSTCCIGSFVVCVNGEYKVES